MKIVGVNRNNLINSSRIGKSFCPPRRAFTLVMAVLIFLPAGFISLKPEKAQAAPFGPQGLLPAAELRVDGLNHARVLCDGIKLAASVGDFFEFYEQSLTGGRKSV